MLRHLQQYLCLCACLVMTPWTARAIPYPLPLDGTPIDIRLTRTDSREVVFEGSSPGRSSQPVYLLAAAPPGAKITVEADQTSGTGTRSPWTLEFSQSGPFADTLTFSHDEIPSKIRELQSRYPNESIPQIEARFGIPIEDVLRQELTNERVYLDVIEGFSVLQRDSCRERKTNIRVILDLSNVAEERFLGDVVVAIALQLLPSSSEQRTLYKPYSERANALAVILLALKNVTGNIALITRWRRGRPRISRSTALTESPYFGNGGIYARYYLPRSKRPERVTVERITVDAQQRIVDAYGTCVELGERRQQINGFR